MTKPSKGNFVSGPPGDILDIGRAVRDGQTQALLTKGTQLARPGLLCLSGVNELNTAKVADFLIQLMVGLNMIAVDAENQYSVNLLASMEAKTPPATMTRARRMQKTFEAGMADAERSLTAPAQMELDLNPLPELPETLDHPGDW